MGNSEGKFSVKQLLNLILNSDETKIKGEITDVVLASGASLKIKDFRGFTVFEVKENGDILHKGKLIKT